MNHSRGCTGRTRLGVLASGYGSNLQAIIDACADGRLDAEVAAVVSDNPDSFALQRAGSAGIGYVRCHRRPKGQVDLSARAYWEAQLSEMLNSVGVELVVLAGFMRILSRVFLESFPNKVINLHPALPGELPGIAAIERAYEQWCRGERQGSGAMVHLVPDEGVDSGPVIGFVPVPFVEGDSLESFTGRMHEAEQTLLVESLARICGSSPTIPDLNQPVSSQSLSIAQPLLRD